MSARASQVRRQSPRADAPHLRLVSRRSGARLRRAASRRPIRMAILVAVCSAAVVFGVLLEQVALGQSAFKLDNLLERLRAAEAKHEELLLEAATLAGSGRIERVARNSLGMVDADAIEYVIADVSLRRNQRSAKPPTRARLATISGVAAPKGPASRP